MRVSLFFILLLPVSFLRAEHFTIEAYDVQVRIDAEGWFEMEETIDVLFTSPRHGIFRYIPFRYLVDNSSYQIRIYDIDVPGHQWQRAWQNDNVKIRIGDPDAYVEGRQRYVIRYRVRHAFLYPENYTEFYWNLVGTGWETQLDTVTYRIELPPGVLLQAEDYRVFTGLAGEQQREATITYQQGAVSGHSLRPFAPGEGLTVSLKLPLDAVRRPTLAQQRWRKYGSLTIPLGLMIFSLALWRRHGFNPAATKVVQYYPPQDLPPAEAGVLLRRQAKQRSIVALLPYWASQGLLQIKEVDEGKKKKRKVDLELIRLQDLPDDRPTYEKWMFEAIFSKGKEAVRLSKLKNRLFATLHISGDQVVETLRHRGYYPPRPPALWRVVLPALLFAAFPLIIVFLVLGQPLTALAIILVMATGLILRFTAVKKSEKGLEAYRHLQGFREFIAKADRPRIERLLKEDPAYFERTLPYAVAFGMTERWLSHFAELFTAPPEWYVPASTSTPQTSAFGAFSSNLGPGLQEVKSVFTSSPGGSSSGGSGGFSGGSSGGGFGGGGGGSW